MAKKLFFDTLEYAKMLRKANVVHPEKQAELLADVLAQNLYSRDEIDAMNENAIFQFKQEMHEIRAEIRDDAHQMRDDLRGEMRLLEGSLARKMSLNLGLITGVVTVATMVSHLLH
ncbi:MAG: hypothetical protein CMF50_03400 [Legionellales bacterium]|nr:hypothetical protein [Legionellales bacterium]|tara:strand:+ start:20191 stop:20538 length:348 start_codon:yes stop_codon:yes gene_type:complete